MALEGRRGNRESTRVNLDPPTFSPSLEMRAEYLEKRRRELGDILFQAGENDWKPVMIVINHVRGSGEMYGFETIGNAAEDVSRAVQGGDADSIDVLRKYADAVNNAAL